MNFEQVDFSEVGMVKCSLYDKNNKKLDSVVIRAKPALAPYPVPQKVCRLVLWLVNKKRSYLAKQKELAAE